MAMTDRRPSRPGFNLASLSPSELARQTAAKAVEHEIVTRAAAVAYYALTALVPFLAVLVTLAAQLAPDITGPSGTRAAIGSMTVDELRQELSRYLPQEAYEVVAKEIARIQNQPTAGLLSVGLVVSLWLASSLSGTIIDALNRIHGVPETRSYLHRTLLAIGLTVLQAVIMLGTLIVLVVWPQVPRWLGWNRELGTVEVLAEWAIVAVAALFSFAVMLHFGPNIRRCWQCITPGSVFGTAVFLASGLLLKVYIRYFGSYGKTYGSLGGVLLLSFWFWIAAVILLVAAQVNKVIEDERTQGAR